MRAVLRWAVLASAGSARHPGAPPTPGPHPPPARLPSIVPRPARRRAAARYASLYFVACIDMNFNELITLEIIHMFVETLDRYFGNVCELDIMCAPAPPNPAGRSTPAAD